MSGQGNGCRETMRHASLYLDGRLRPDSRRRVQTHLRACPACLQAYREIGRLSRATHNLPPRRVDTDLAHRVRTALSRRRAATMADLGRRPRRRLAAAGVVVLLGVAWGLGFVTGRARQSPRPAAAPVQHANEFTRAAQGMLSELAVIDSIAPAARRPLLSAQLARFELGPTAARVLRARSTTDDGVVALARFVRDLSDEIDHAGEIDWAAWRREADRRGLLASQWQPR